MLVQKLLRIESDGSHQGTAYSRIYLIVVYESVARSWTNSFIFNSSVSILCVL